MDIDEKTSQTNTFAGGMDTDTSDALIKDSQYRLANNLRYITNTEENTGELHLIDGADFAYTFSAGNNTKILNTTQIRDYGVIVWETTDGDKKHWGVSTIRQNDIKNPKIVFGPCEGTLANKPSLVTRYEDSDNIKLYIADGESPLMAINLADPKDNGNTIENIQAYNNGILLPAKFCGWVPGLLKAGMVQYAYMLYHKHGKTTIMSPITKLIQLPKDSTVVGKRVEGQEENKETSCGVKLQINITDSKITDHFDRILVYRIHYLTNGQTPTCELIVDKVRTSNIITVQDTGQEALDSLTLEEFNNISGIHIVPRLIESKNDYLFAANIKDTTYDSDILEIEENGKKVKFDTRSFSYSESSDVQPTVRLYDYASREATDYDPSNVPDNIDCWNPWTDVNTVDGTDDKSIYKYTRQSSKGGVQYFGGTGKYIDWRFVVTNIDGDTCSYNNSDFDGDQVGTAYNIQSLDEANTIGNKIDCYYIATKDGQRSFEKISFDRDEFGIGSESSNRALNYSNPIISYAFKSLKREEVYRYGIVFYDQNNHASPVSWIADIRVPAAWEQGFETFISHAPYGNNKNIDLAVRPIGVQFIIKNYPPKAVAYEIVRCNRTNSDISTLSQGVISRPIKRRVFDNDPVTDYPYTPSGFLTTGKFVVTADNTFYSYEDEVNMPKGTDGLFQADNVQNDGLFQFVSPEVCYLKDTMQTYIQNAQLKLNPIKYVFGKREGFRTKDRAVRSTVETMEPSTNNLHPYAGPFRYDQESYPTLPSGLPADYNGDPFKTAITFSTKTAFPQLYQAQFSTNSDTGMGQLTESMRYSRNMGTARKPSNKMFKADWLVGVDEINDDALVRYSGDESYKVTHDAYAYIKLYEQSNQIMAYEHKGKPGVYWAKGQSLSGLGTTHEVVGHILDSRSLFDVDRSGMSYELNWDDGEVQSSKDQKYTMEYDDKRTAVGSYSFNNWISWCVTGYAQSLGAKANDYGIGGYANHGLESPMGPGGRALLLALNVEHNNTGVNILADTVGAPNVLSYRSDGIAMPIQPTDAQTGGLPATKAKFTDAIGEQHNVFMESSFGTFICNLKHNVTPYGGSDYQTRQLNTYYSYGDYHIIDKTRNVQNPVVFDGDCFIEPFEYVSWHKAYFKSDEHKYMPTFSVVYSIPVETNINLTLTDGTEFSRKYDEDGITNIQIEPSDVNELFVQEEPLYRYNTVYSQNPIAKLFEADSENADESSKNKLDYRVYYSERKDNDERRDNWLTFKPANYLDVDTRYGQITELRTFHNQLLFWQESAAGLLSVNERVQITDDSNMPLILGTGGVLSRYDYMNTRNGMKAGQFVDAQSDGMLIWWDENNGEICAYSGEGANVLTLSKSKSVQNFINKQITDNGPVVEPIISYDKKFNEFILNILNGDDHNSGSLIYSEMAQAFTGLYTIYPKFYIAFNGGLLLIDDKNNIAKWNKISPKNAVGIDGEKELKPYLKYVVNKNPQFVKVFDQAEFGGRFYYHYENDGIKHISSDFSTPLKQHGHLNGNEISDREYSFRYDVPREDGADFGKRLRGKSMQVELSSDSNSTDFSLQYITTKFRISWS